MTKKTQVRSEQCAHSKWLGALLLLPMLFTACADDNPDGAADSPRELFMRGYIVPRTAWNDGSWREGTRTTVQNLSDWQNMKNRGMSVRYLGTIYGNYEVAPDGTISTGGSGPTSYITVAAGVPPTEEIYIWYPSTGTTDISGALFTVGKDQTDSAKIEACDLLAGRSTVSLASSGIRFLHKTAKMQVILKINRVYHDEDDNIITVSSPIDSAFITNIRRYGKYYDAGGDTLMLSPLYTVRDTIFMFQHNQTGTPVIDADGYSTDTMDCLFPPQHTHTYFSVKIGDKKYKSYVDSCRFRAGRVYTVHASLYPGVN